MNKLLLVDDEPDILNFLGPFCAREGYEVSTAGDGLEALAMVVENNYDIVITNIRMPKIDGIDLLRIVRDIKSNTKVIMHTACHHLEEDAGKCGAYAFFKKPISLTAFRGYLKKISSTTPEIA